AASLAGCPAADDDLLVPGVLDLDPVPAGAGVVAGGQRLADDPFKAVREADGPDVCGAAAVRRRGADRVLVQAEVLEPGPAPGIRDVQQGLLSMVEQVEQVQPGRRGADQR